MYMISMGLDMLLDWGFLAEREGKLQITNDGRQALVSYKLKMEHIRMLRDTIRKGPVAKDEEDVIKWAMNDFGVPEILKDDDDEGRDDEEPYDGRLDAELEDAIWKYIQNTPYKQVVKQSNVVKFFDTRETLEQIFGSYLAFTPPEARELTKLIRLARNRIHYGCKKELLPLMILELGTIRDPLVAAKLMNNRVDDVFKLATLDPDTFWKITGVGPDDSRLTIDQAKSVVRLVSEFSGVRSDLNKLAAQTGVKFDDLFDYLLPAPMVERLRK